MKPLLDGAIELPLDQYRIRIDELEQKNAELEKRSTALEQENERLKALLKEQQSS